MYFVLGSWIAAIAVLIYRFARRYPKTFIAIWIVLIVIGQLSKPQPDTTTVIPAPAPFHLQACPSGMYDTFNNGNCYMTPPEVTIP